MSKRDPSGEAVTGGTLGLSTTVCPYPATKVDFCPHAVMTWRNHRTVCDYAHKAHDSGAVAILCSSPHRVLRTRLDAPAWAAAYAATSRRGHIEVEIEHAAPAP